MTALTKLRDQIAIARQTGTFVVLTPDEAQGIVDECADMISLDAARGIKASRSAPPHEGDDEHHD